MNPCRKVHYASGQQSSLVSARAHTYTGTPAARAIAAEVHRRSALLRRLGFTRASTSELLRPSPRDSTSTEMLSAASSCAKRMTSGVFPAPPTDKLPTLTTGHASRCGCVHPRSVGGILRADRRRVERNKKREGPNHALSLSAAINVMTAYALSHRLRSQTSTARARPLPRQRQDLRADPAIPAAMLKLLPPRLRSLRAASRRCRESSRNAALSPPALQTARVPADYALSGTNIPPPTNATEASTSRRKPVLQSNRAEKMHPLTVARAKTATRNGAQSSRRVLPAARRPHQTALDDVAREW